METERAIGQASVQTVEKKWVKVQIYTPTHICTGYANYRQGRLLDFLNGVSVGGSRINKEFLPVSEVEMKSLLDGSDMTVQSAYLNKANILFVRAIEGGQTMGLGDQVGHKLYPFVGKSSTAVRLYLPSFTLTGQMHCAKGKRVWDVLNSELRFLPLTNVEIYPSAGSSESGVSFIAVNKSQVLSLEELGTPWQSRG